MSKIVAIGDIHAYGDMFSRLMDELAHRVDFDTTTLVFLGDYVDGGPDAYQVISKLMDYQKQYPHWVMLKGNHEDLLLDSVVGKSAKYGNYYLWWNQGGKQTTHSYIEVSTLTAYEKALAKTPDIFIPKEHIAFLSSLPLQHETEKYIFVHGGLSVGKTVEETHPHTKMWMRNPFIKSEYDWGKRVIFGHTYHREPLVMPNKIGIDTCHHGGGKLTAVILPLDGGDDIDWVFSYDDASRSGTESKASAGAIRSSV